jgi:hypothetical protein
MYVYRYIYIYIYIYIYKKKWTDEQTERGMEESVLMSTRAKGKREEVFIKVAEGEGEGDEKGQGTGKVEDIGQNTIIRQCRYYWA